MSVNEIVYIFAYCCFLAGAAKSFRENGSTTSVWIMSVGVLLDFLVSMLPMAGVKALKMNLQGTNPAIIFGIVFGFVVWVLYVIALVLRKKNKMALYHKIITITEIVWFIDFIAFLYGMYKFPLK